MAMIELTGFRKRYGRFEAVHSLSLGIEEGQVFGLIGSNGAGKTTIFRFLATLIEPTSGGGMINGYNVLKEVRQVRKSIGYMPDQIGTYPGMRVWEFLDFFASAYGIKRWRRKNLIGDLLELVDLSEKRFEQVDSLSRGMKQRLMLARALVHDPPVLILDEPASGLDPRARLEVREFLRELSAMGKTILISSHILSELADICTSFGIIEQGTMLAQGPLDDVLTAVRSYKIYTIRVLEGMDQAHQFLSKYEKIFDLETGSGHFKFSFYGDDKDAAKLLLTLLKLKVSVAEFKEQTVDLEEAFFRLTKGLVG